MRIGIDGRLWNETGVGRYIRNLVDNLTIIDTKNQYVLFVTSETAVAFKTHDKTFPDNWKIVRCDIRWHTIAEQLELPRVLDKEKLDLMHFPYFSVPLLYRKPFVITIHDLIVHHFPTGKASTLPAPIYYAKHASYKFIIKNAAKRAQKVIAVSNATKQEIIDHLEIPARKIDVTYEGVDPQFLSNTITTVKQFEIDDISYLLYVGNAYPHKNLERLITAFELALSDNPDLKLVLVGKKNYFYTKLSEYVHKKKLGKSIIFFGQASDGELQSLYQHATACIFPSLMEGFGLPGLEALQSGCLLLASDIPVFREMYKDTALYFDPLVPESIHATIQQVLSAKTSFTERKRQGKKLAQSFSWETMSQQTQKVYLAANRSWS